MTSSKFILVPLLVSLLSACSENSPSAGSDGAAGSSSDGDVTASGGSSSAGSGGGTSSNVDDPCGVAGKWSNGCGSVKLCGSCSEANMDLGVEFEISATIARDGGQFGIGAATLTFDVESCTLTTTSNYCAPWTDDSYVLRNGEGTGTAHAHCKAGAACECEVETECSPTRL